MTSVKPGATIQNVPDAPVLPGLTFRTGTPADWDAIAAVTNRKRRADGVEEVLTAASLAGEHPESPAFEMTRDVLLAEMDGHLAGFAIGHRGERLGILVAESWGAVDPDHQRRGIGTALHRATRARLAAECAADPRPGPREHRCYALEVEAGERALFAAEGFVPVRYGFEMRRPLTGGLPERPMPDGLELRPVTADQHRAIYDGDNEAFEDHWGHRTPEDTDFKRRFHGPDVDTSLWCVAWDGDEVAGIVMNAIYQEENEKLGVRRGWLEHVSVRRPWRGRGLAKALCAASFRLLREHGIDEAWLGVDASNPTGALQLYEGLGFTSTRRWEAFGRPLDRPAPDGWRSGDRGDAAEGG